MKIDARDPRWPDPSPGGVQLRRAIDVLMIKYGNVIGRAQAESICYHALVAARQAAMDAVRGTFES